MPCQAVVREMLVLSDTTLIYDCSSSINPPPPDAGKPEMEEETRGYGKGNLVCLHAHQPRSRDDPG